MRKSELKRMLKDGYNNMELPDHTDEILDRVDHRVIAVPKRSTHRIFLPLALALSSLILVISLLFLFPRGRGDRPINSELVVSKKEEVLSREIIALGNIVGEVDTNQSKLMSYSFTNEEYDSIAKEVNKYLYTTSIFMEKDEVTINYLMNEDKNYSDYKYKMEILFKDNEVHTSSYLAYYNEEKSNTTVEIEGIIIIDGIERALEGEREDEGDEVELELKVMYGDNSYISIKNETEINENEYKYTFVENGVVVKGVSMEVELEGSIKQTEIKITENDMVTKFEFTYNPDNIEASFKDSARELEMIIYPHDTYYLYTFDGSDYELRLEK